MKNEKYTIERLMPEQKLRILVGKDLFRTDDLDGELYCVKMSDGPIGVRLDGDEIADGKAKHSVAYPSAQVLSQTWDEELAYAEGRMIADDCIERGIDVLLAPGINIKRDPLCGRNFEYLSEDPCLAGVFGREFIRGLQEKHVGATVKHFAANNSEYSRFWVSSEVDERTLREIYLKPFEIVCDAKPWAVMCSYNLVNGVRMSEHKKLFGILRNEFGFDGIIVSDWNAVQDRVKSAKAGLDLQMPGREDGRRRLKEGYESGELTTEEIDACASRVLEFIRRCEEGSALRKVETTVKERLGLSRKIAENGIVLLKNNGILPLKNGTSVSLSGDGAVGYVCGKGSSCVTPVTEPVSLESALRTSLPDSEISFRGIWEHDNRVFEAVENSYGKGAAIVCASIVDGESDDRYSMRLDPHEEDLILQTAKQNANVVVVLYCGAPVDMSAWIDRVGAVIYAGYPGEMGNAALADILAGKVNPCGKLTESFPLTLRDAPARRCYRDCRVNHYSDGLFVGYRYFDMREQSEENLKYLFPFGFGLSYSSFCYRNLTVKAKNGAAELKFELENLSEVDGAEIAQVYVREVHPCVMRPYKELKAFRKIFLKGREKKQVTVTLCEKDFSFYSVAEDGWTHKRGIFEIMVGASSRDIKLKEAVEL